MQPEKEQILFVEDDVVFRNRLSRSLKTRGYEVLEASNVSDAQDLIREHGPKLAIFDLCLGEESGLPLVSTLKARSEDSSCVVLTGYGTISTAVSALKAGAVNYLTKPVHVGEVLQALEIKNESASDSAQSDETAEQPTLMQVEWQHIQRVLKDCDGNVTRAADRLGVHRRTLQRKLSKIPSPLK